MANETLKNEAIAQLQKYVAMDSEVIVVMHSVSKSGMSRKLSVYVVDAGKKLIWLNGFVSQAGICKIDINQKLIVNGCGMDILFHLSYLIKSKLYGSKIAQVNQQYYSIY